MGVDMLCARHEGSDAFNPNEPRSEDCPMCQVELTMARILPPMPRYRYFGYRGWMYCWTTERMSDGRFAAFVYKPVGEGARTGRANSWKLVKELRFAKRSTAKARALRWRDAAKAKAV